LASQKVDASELETMPEGAIIALSSQGSTMVRSLYLLIVSIVVLGACNHRPSVETQVAASRRVYLGHDPVIRPLGERLAFLFDDGSVFIQVSDGSGGPPILYHDKPLPFERLKSVRRLSASEVRERLGDQTLVGGFLIEVQH
jgi:hypothetical protein